MEAPRSAKAKADAAIVDRYDSSEKADVVRQKCKEDLRFFYLNVLDVAKRGIGRLHDFMIDATRIYELDRISPSACHSPIREHLPPRDDDGCYKERWLYFPTLDAAKPVIQEGGEGPLLSMFQNESGLWRGFLIRIKGDGHTLAQLYPRGHLKTELIVCAKTLHRIICNPQLRTSILSSAAGLACRRMLQIQRHFETNNTFQALFGNLYPVGRQEVWNSSELQVAVEHKIHREPTVTAQGANSRVTGNHFDILLLDDVVERENSRTPEACEKVSDQVGVMTFLGDPGHFIEDVGTIWADNDAHAKFISPESDCYEDSSFIVSTVRDANDALIWPEYTEQQFRRAKNQCQTVFDFYCQYYNQPIAGATDSFDRTWIKWYNEDGDENPLQQIVKHKLDLVMMVDPANSTSKQSDFTACTVVGQAPDGHDRYLVGGFRERIKAAELVPTIADELIRWQDIATECGVGFRFGMETFSFQQFVNIQLRDEMRKRGRGYFCHEVAPQHRRKQDRIKLLLTPFMTGRYHIPVKLMRTDTSSGKGYDLVQHFLREYTKFPRGGAHDDFLDTMAYVEELLRPAPLTEVADYPEPERLPDQYFRDGGDGEEDSMTPAEFMQSIKALPQGGLAARMSRGRAAAIRRMGIIPRGRRR